MDNSNAMVRNSSFDGGQKLKHSSQFNLMYNFTYFSKYDEYFKK